jgi:hypothetical protein
MASSSVFFDSPIAFRIHPVDAIDAAHAVRITSGILGPLAVALCLSALIPTAALAQVPAVCRRTWSRAGYTVGWIMRTHGVQLSPEAAARFCSASPECIAALHHACERARNQDQGPAQQQTPTSNQSEPQALTPSSAERLAYAGMGTELMIEISMEKGNRSNACTFSRMSLYLSESTPAEFKQIIGSESRSSINRNCGYNATSLLPTSSQLSRLSQLGASSAIGNASRSGDNTMACRAAKHLLAITHERGNNSKDTEHARSRIRMYCIDSQ